MILCHLLHAILVDCVARQQEAKVLSICSWWDQLTDVTSFIKSKVGQTRTSIFEDLRLSRQQSGIEDHWGRPAIVACCCSYISGQ
jgi:hypothetical protein